jgi:hypothetical protein
MTRKDYYLIANAIRVSGLDVEDMGKVARALTIEFLKDNERFDPARFWEACVGEQSKR